LGGFSDVLVWPIMKPMRTVQIALLAGVGAIVVSLASFLACRIGFSRGVEAGLATGIEVEQVAHGVAALSIIRQLEAGHHDEALAELDAQVDAGISAHRIRTQAPSLYADVVESPAELITHLEAYRRSRPSSARNRTPNMNRLVADFLAERDKQ
jgi:hypothetical protein